LRELEAHALELANRLAELLPLKCVGHRLLECALREADHLCRYPDSALGAMKKEEHE
jgi:hypothetical protein